MFSLTNDDKFVNENNSAGIYQRMNNDFCFQLGTEMQTDFCIVNRANTLKSSIANINIGYKNKNYKNGETVSYEKLTGSKLQYFKCK